MIEKIASYHNLWIQMASKLANPTIAEDCVQEAYIKLIKLIEAGKDITYGDDVNKFYVYLTIRSVVNDYYRNKNKFNISDDADTLDTIEYVETDLAEQEAFDRIYTKVVNCINNLPNNEDYPQYLKDKVPHFINLFIGYNGTDKSMRQISEETGIRLGTIHQTLNKVMAIVRREVGEDVQDYFNRDYHLI